MTQQSTNGLHDENSQDESLSQEQLQQILATGENASQLLNSPVYNMAYQRLLNAHPSMAGYVARDCAAWRDWSLVPLLRTVKARDTRDDPGAAYAVSYYLSMAREASRP